MTDKTYYVVHKDTPDCYVQIRSLYSTESFKRVLDTVESVPYYRQECKIVALSYETITRTGGPE